jgi:hypothetical protein
VGEEAIVWQAGLELTEVAMILGWKQDRAGEIAAR